MSSLAWGSDKPIQPGSPVPKPGQPGPQPTGPKPTHPPTRAS